MRRLFPFSLLLLFAIFPSLGLISPAVILPQAESASLTPTAAAPADAYIEVTYDEQISVRTGPNSHIYDRIGGLFPGETAPALGISSGGQWIQIRYPATGELGWVFFVNVKVVSSAPLPTVQAPPTPTIAITPTLNPTVAAILVTSVPPTGVATYTPPSPLQIRTYTPSAPVDAPVGPISMGLTIILLGFLGGLGMIISFLRKN